MDEDTKSRQPILEQNLAIARGCEWAIKPWDDHPDWPPLIVWRKNPPTFSSPKGFLPLDALMDAMHISATKYGMDVSVECSTIPGKPGKHWFAQATDQPTANGTTHSAWGTDPRTVLTEVLAPVFEREEG